MPKYKQENTNYQFNSEELQKMMNNFRAGIDVESTQMYFVNVLDNFIINEINHFATGKVHVEKEDLKQEAYMKIFEVLPDYQPIDEKGNFIKPTSYFGCHIRGVIYRDAMPKTTTAHYNKAYLKIKECCAKYGLELSCNRTMIETYKALTGLPAKTIEEAIKQHSMKEIEPDNTLSDASNKWNPEQYVEQQARSTELNLALNTLSELEYYICQEIMIDNALIGDVKKIINNNLDNFELEKPIETHEIKDMIVSIKQKLQFELRGYAKEMYRPAKRLRKAEKYYTKEKLDSQKSVLLCYLDDELCS